MIFSVFYFIHTYVELSILEEEGREELETLRVALQDSAVMSLTKNIEQLKKEYVSNSIWHHIYINIVGLESGVSFVIFFSEILNQPILLG